MKDVTQGTLIYGMRSRKYPGVITYGIIISAACDLAQEKINKVFYLIAIPIKEWLCSDEGFQVVTASCVNSCKQNITKILEKYGLAWDVIETLSQEEFEKVIAENDIPQGERKNSLAQYQKYVRITKEAKTHDEKIAVYKSEHKIVESYLGTLFAGGNTHYVFIPGQALSEQISVGHGLVVDLLELDYFPIELAKEIADGKIDYNVLSGDEILNYDKQFILSENEGFAYPVGRINHPWSEYVLQHFSNCFIRIGVDNPEKAEVKGIVENLFQKEEQP